MPISVEPDNGIVGIDISVSKISLQSQVSTRQTTSGMFVAASSSNLGSKLLQLKYITEKDLLAIGLEDEIIGTEFGLKDDPPPVVLLKNDHYVN